MDACEPTTNNAELWACFLAEQWAFWLDPFATLAPSRTVNNPIATSAAASIASTLELIVAPAVNRMFVANAASVTQFLRETALAPDDVIVPSQYAVSRADDASPSVAYGTSPAREHALASIG